MEKMLFNENEESNHLLFERRIFEYTYHIPERRKSTYREDKHRLKSKDHHDEPAQLKKRKIYT